MQYDLLVTGDLNVDLNLIGGDVTPDFGQVEKLVDDASLNLGGSSTITACQAARLGLRVAFAGVVGDDAFGRFVLDALRAAGVDAQHVKVHPTVRSGITVHLVREADRAMLTYLGTLGILDTSYVTPDLLAQTRHLHSGSFYVLPALRPGLLALYAEAKRLGVTTSIDTNFDPSGAWAGGLPDVLAHTDVFLPNEQELQGIARQPDIGAALDWAVAQTPTVAVKLGAAGAVARAGGATARWTPPAVRVVDTTGAGDSFNGGFLYGYLNGWPLLDCVKLGCACGSLSTGKAGGTASQPALAEACAFAGLAASTP